jgi:hypothetical protein
MTIVLDFKQQKKKTNETLTRDDLQLFSKNSQQEEPTSQRSDKISFFQRIKLSERVLCCEHSTVHGS